MSKVRGKYFDDIQVGDVFETGRRTVTLTDIVNFACLSGDFNEVHTNWEYCKETPFGEPIAHGPLVYSIAAGLNYASGINDGTLVALLGTDDWRMVAPVKSGDTIFMRSEVLETRLTSKGDRGVVTVRRTIFNQRQEVVQQMVSKMLFRCRPSDDSDD
ncbi:hypothetical protein GCM10023350_09260 [Nocardioides endophyticus]|uniref:MaoC-like domain-containing protein n=1 Tax=Nocardioides endophyticus TaxID=1353775 RepID=A0ABP8YEX4_9ACTN